MSDNKGYIVFDIETAPSRYDEYRSAFPMSKKKPGLHAFISQTVAIGICGTDFDDCRVVGDDAKDEKALLKWFSNVIECHPGVVLVGYNIRNFDIPFLRVRAAKLGVPIQLPARNSIRIVDIYDLMGGRWQADTSSGTLSELKWYLYGGPKETGGGDQVAKWFANCEYDKIREHCLEDIALCDRIYREYKGALF